VFLRVGISIIAHFPIVSAKFKAVKRRSKKAEEKFQQKTRFFNPFFLLYLMFGAKSGIKRN
jgi:hypothetical protein